MTARRVVLAVLLAVATASHVWASQTTARYAGRPVADVLAELQSRGLKLIFSSELVRPDMKVVSEPNATSLRGVVDQILAPHALRVEAGPRNTLLVVRSARKKAAAATAAPTRTGSIHGLIVDKRTRTPLPGVTVAIRDSKMETISALDGTFALDRVPAEPQTLFVSLVGYGLARPSVNVIPDGVVEVSIALADGVGGYSDEVTVVADPLVAGSPSRQSLTTADFQDLRGVLADDPLRAIQALPSVATGDDFRSEFSVRASDFRHIGTSIDGVPSTWLVHSVRGLDETGSVSIVNGDVIDRATLDSGPYAQRFPGRTGAWLDFGLREGSRTSAQGHLAVSGTTSSISADGPIGKSRRGSWLFSFRESYLQWLLKVIDTENASAFGFTDAQVKFVYDVTPKQQLQLAIVGGRSKLDESDDKNPGASSVSTGIDRMGVVTAAWRWTFPRAVLTQHAAWSGGDFVNHGRFSLDLSDGRSSAASYVAELAATIRPSFTLRAGGSLTRDRARQVLREWIFAPGLTSTTLKSSTSVDASARQAHAFAGALWTNSHGGAIDAGAAITNSTAVDQTSASPWLTATVPVGHRITLRGGGALSHQIPELEQIQMAGAERLRPERAVSVDVGLEQRLSAGLLWRLTAYSRDEHEMLRADGIEARLIGGQVVAGAAVPVWRNALNGSARGIELQLQRRGPAKVSGWIGYSYGRARYTDRDTGERYWADFDQRHALNAYGQLRMSPKTSASAKLRLGTNFPITGYFSHIGSQLTVGTVRNEERLPRYARLDIRLNHTFTYTKRRLSLFVEVVNALARTNYGPSAGFARVSGIASGYTQTLLPFLPSAGFVFDF